MNNKPKIELKALVERVSVLNQENAFLKAEVDRLRSNLAAQTCLARTWKMLLEMAEDHRLQDKRATYDEILRAVRERRSDPVVTLRPLSKRHLPDDPA